MPDTGGILTPINASVHLTQSEDRPLIFTVRDVDGEPVVSFSGWTFAFYVAKRQRDARGDPPISGNVLISKTSASGVSGNVPDVTVELDPDDTSDLNAGGYFYGLWRTDTDDNVRLAYGPFVIID